MPENFAHEKGLDQNSRFVEATSKLIADEEIGDCKFKVDGLEQFKTSLA